MCVKGEVGDEMTEKRWWFDDGWFLPSDGHQSILRRFSAAPKQHPATAVC